MELINQELVRVGNPSHFDLPRLLRIQAQECVPASDRGPLQEAIDYFDGAQNAILRSILAPISKVIS